MRLFLSVAASAGLLMAAQLHAQPKPNGRVTDVPDNVRQAVIDHLQHTFVYPDLVIWHFEYMQPYPTGGLAICGNLDLPDSTRHYERAQPFYAHYVDGRVVESGIVSPRQNEDPVFSNRAAFGIACQPR